jgi:hypothetical protein
MRANCLTFGVLLLTACAGSDPIVRTWSDGGSVQPSASPQGSADANGGSGDDGGAASAAGACASHSDCTSGQFCSASGLPSISCYAFALSQDGSIPCSLDSECAAVGASYICGPTSTVDYNPCLRGTCVPGCSDTLACKEGEQCNTGTHRCFVPPCAAASDCGADSFCNAGVCTPKPCSTASDCAGQCFNGGCYTRLGICVPQFT